MELAQKNRAARRKNKYKEKERIQRDSIRMDKIRLETKRLVLREFEEKDMEAIYLLLSDEEVNTFLPFYPVKDMDGAIKFFEEHWKGQKYCFGICLKDDPAPIGYVNVKTEDESHDLGYALRKEYWHQGIASEASNAVIGLAKKVGIPYLTATHDRNNPRSGAVMKRIGMKYCYSYKEQWQPKNFPVIFRMYQLNLDGENNRVYRGYWNLSDERFIETDI